MTCEPRCHLTLSAWLITFLFVRENDYSASEDVRCHRTKFNRPGRKAPGIRSPLPYGGENVKLHFFFLISTLGGGEL